MKAPILSLALGMAACALIARTVNAAEPLRIMTFNLRYINTGDSGNRTWVARRDLVAKVMREDKADVIGVQEAFRSMLDDLRQRVPGYQEIGVGREDGKNAGEFSAILIRTDRIEVRDSGTFWLSDTPEVVASSTWKNQVTRICTWARLADKASGREFYHFNTHFDHESQEAREKAARLIGARAMKRAQGLPVLVTGDFNATEDNPAIVEMKAGPLRLVDAWRARHPEVAAADSGTMSHFTGAPNDAKIDYIFVPAGTEIVDADVIRTHEQGIYPSDHYPVRATIRFGSEVP